ncbi:phosphosulfolactate synthase [Streptomyces albicerus]|uniref:phosphosulfolactate synthase n=1 Tax=Streptomyces albicerus TaxID=2569859 RepID=UPI001788B59E|nr:phosphosulfolactate synthase [Streptomyces albicerus]
MADSVSSRYLRELGVAEPSPLTSPFDPGEAPCVLESHLQQSAGLMERIKLSMSCWIIADYAATQTKVTTARKHEVPTVAGGGPFEIAAAHDKVAPYLELCADAGFDRMEVSQGFVRSQLDARQIVADANALGLEVQYELGSKHLGKFTAAAMDELVEEGYAWLAAGVVDLVIEAREDARNIGLFDEGQQLNTRFADRFVEAWGLDSICFEAPTKRSQFALLDHYGSQVRLSNVRFGELLRVETYRRGLHSDAYRNEKLRPGLPEVAVR